ncbi:cation:proton antiporter [Marinilabilia sp.]|uniref:cation:proton antiporter n=1 Tax=Marinilabilia sp. TaxID=2021252 RepID=UPI0025C70ADB|nr:cation:proton antiporter [Marinilabilia sp.]
MSFDFLDIDLPVIDPVVKFLIILLVILVIPILSERLRIPQLLGMIVAGIVIGPHGFNLLARDSSIILSGTAGLLYIMFQAGLEIDMNDFKRHAFKSTMLGLYGFFIPMILGIILGVILLGFSLSTSTLLASMFASHTLITYPIVSKLGITKNTAVNISVGSTLITNTLALFVLAIIVGMSNGEINNFFWLQLLVSFIAFTLIITFVFPRIARWFFKRFSDSVSQYVFVLVIVFLGAVLLMAAGIEAIIGAFMSGLALNRLIPRTSPLMNRINFVGNAIFIPFFLIGVGMLINYRSFSNLETIMVAVSMSIVATLAKYLAALATQKSFKLSRDDMHLIFGLTNSQAAATLAAVLVGYNIVLGHTPDGDPIRLLNDSVLNGTIIMILVTCTIASFVTQKSAQKISTTEQMDGVIEENKELILIPLSNPENIEEMVNLSTIIKSKRNLNGFFALNIINRDNTDTELEKRARQLLNKARVAASATDMELQTLLRYDLDVVHGITNVIKEHNITDLILGLHVQKGMSDTFLGNLTEGILSKNNFTTYIYNPFQPISTIGRHIVVVPENAEYESGFSFWVSRIWNIAGNTGAKILFYSDGRTLKLLREIHSIHPIDAEFNVFNKWDDFLILSRDVSPNNNLIIVMSRKGFNSYHPAMEKITSYLNNYFQYSNFLIIYPRQEILLSHEKKINLTDSSMLETIEKIDTIGKTLANIFRRKEIWRIKREQN